MPELKKKQHYVNQAYLSNFCDQTQSPTALWVYDNSFDYMGNFAAYKHRVKTTAQVCYGEFFYEGNDLPANTVENALATIENDFSLLIKEKVEKRLPLDQKDKETLSLFVAIMEARTQAQRENVEGFQDRVIAKVKAMEKQHNVPPRKSDELEKAKANNEMFIVNVQVAIEINRWQAAEWYILEAPDDFPFITSDNPTLLYDFALLNSFYGPPAFCKTSELTFPLTPKFAVVANHVDIGGCQQASYNEVSEVNNRTVMSSHKHFYSSKKLEIGDLKNIYHRQRQCLALNQVILQKVTRLDKIMEKYKNQEKSSS